jgi:hypothetical protein
MREGDSITITVPAVAFERACEMASGGPMIMSTSQAAAVYGWDAKRWRGWAESGRVDGAWQEEDTGHWRLPRDGCQRLIDEFRRKGRKPPRKGCPSVHGESRTAEKGRVDCGERTKPRTPTRRSVRRGPRKAN